MSSNVPLHTGFPKEQENILFLNKILSFGRKQKRERLMSTELGNACSSVVCEIGGIIDQSVLRGPDPIALGPFESFVDSR